MHAKPPHKKPEIQIRDANLKQMKQLLNDGLVSISTYYSRVQDLYEFEPRRKYVEELVDTDDSDVTSDDNDDSDESDHDSDAQPCANEPSANEPTASEPVIVEDDGKIACETCGKRFKQRGMSIHKATHRK